VDAPAVLGADTVVQLRRGVAPERVVSVGDPAMRVGHTSERVSWAGYKAHLSVETGAEFIPGLAVSDANAYDGDLALPILRQQQAVGLRPAALIGDRAYSTAEVRVAVAAAGSELVARVPPAAARAGCFSKDAFALELGGPTGPHLTCPAGVVTQEVRPHSRGQVFIFRGATCAACALRARCTTRSPDTMQRRAQGRTVFLHPLEAVLQQARAAAATPHVQALLRQRVAVERRLAHLMRTGLRQARYVSQAKVEAQALATALVVNLRRLGALVASAPPVRDRCEHHARRDAGPRADRVRPYAASAVAAGARSRRARAAGGGRVASIGRAQPAARCRR
jgi:IS5 family transposase